MVLELEQRVIGELRQPQRICICFTHDRLSVRVGRVVVERVKLGGSLEVSEGSREVVAAGTRYDVARRCVGN
jgi:hypothetical protein